MTPESPGPPFVGSRPSFICNALCAGLTAALFQAQALVAGRGWIEAAQAATLDLTEDTFNGLLAFVLPGSDAYSLHQGVSAADGGVDAGVLDVFIATVDESTPFVPSFSAQVAAILNGLAQIVNAAPSGPFLSPFARLSFVEKIGAFQIMDATDPLKLLGGLLPLFTAFFCYSEAGSLDPAIHSLPGKPLGLQLGRYGAGTDCRDELLACFTAAQY